MDEVLKATGVEKTYGLHTKQPFKALKGIDLTINENDFICIMGPSGSGKSTFINVISTIDNPTGGRVVIGGQDVTEMTEEQLGRFKYENLGFIFQDFNLIGSLTISENIAVPLSLSHKSKQEIIQDVEAVAKKLGIDHLLHKYPEECSGGQRQRAAIARALVNQPKLIVADEPTGNLDSENSHEILRLFKQLNDEDGVTILMVTHDSMIASYSKKLLFIKDGELETTIEKLNKTQKEYYYEIVDANSKESQELFQ
ncbi:ABC transporter ATP-binding protein [Beduini massiliensis]|uniref:ABC transporter ATP-binding protein n=1 Tax=Beduini massiliensis TaxID=1585974 RepID=UPI00059AAD04|nr:ABC transporter ATP-binding protein [Beduini massiliensis]